MVCVVVVDLLLQQDTHSAGSVCEGSAEESLLWRHPSNHSRIENGESEDRSSFSSCFLFFFNSFSGAEKIWISCQPLSQYSKQWCVIFICWEFYFSLTIKGVIVVVACHYHTHLHLHFSTAHHVCCHKCHLCTLLYTNLVSASTTISFQVKNSNWLTIDLGSDVCLNYNTPRNIYILW